MVCPKCKSEMVTTQVVSTTQTVRKRHGLIYWLCFGWLISAVVWFVKWFFFTIPALILKLFGIGGKKTNVVTTHSTVCVCQNCGHTWKVK